MKSMSLEELQDHIQELNSIAGAQLQEIETHPKGLAFAFYKKGRIWWILDLTIQQPMSLVLFEETPWKKKSGPKPVALFLNSHAKNTFLTKAEILLGQGRVISVELASNSKKITVEVHLIPKAVNVIVQDGDKKIAWAKPRDLGTAPVMVGSHRELTDLKFEWLNEQASKNKNQNSEVPLKKEAALHQAELALEKKRKALMSMTDQLQADHGQLWQQLGEILKSTEIQQLDPQWKSFVGEDSDRIRLMQKCFEKAKQFEKKKQGTKDRIEILTKEIVQLEKSIATGNFPAQKSGQVRHQLKDAKAEGRTKSFDGFTASKGKSAADNLALLRSAKAWDLWVHLRDYPSSHLIIAIDKGKKVPDAVVMQAALWLAESSVKSKGNVSGMKLDVVVSECRFVRPIKGDKIGRVHYQNEKVLTVIIP